MTEALKKREDVEDVEGEETEEVQPQSLLTEKFKLKWSECPDRFHTLEWGERVDVRWTSDLRCFEEALEVDI